MVQPQLEIASLTGNHHDCCPLPLTNCQVVVCARGSTILMVSMRTGALIHSINAHRSPVSALALLPSYSRVSKKYCEIATAAWKAQQDKSEYYDNLHFKQDSAIFSPAFIVSASFDGQMCVFEAQTGIILSSFSIGSSIYELIVSPAPASPVSSMRSTGAHSFAGCWTVHADSSLGKSAGSDLLEADLIAVTATGASSSSLPSPAALLTAAGANNEEDTKEGEKIRMHNKKLKNNSNISGRTIRAVDILYERVVIDDLLTVSPKTVVGTAEFPTNGAGRKRARAAPRYKCASAIYDKQIGGSVLIVSSGDNVVLLSHDLRVRVQFSTRKAERQAHGLFSGVTSTKKSNSSDGNSDFRATDITCLCVDGVNLITGHASGLITVWYNIPLYLLGVFREKPHILLRNQFAEDVLATGESHARKSWKIKNKCAPPPNTPMHWHAHPVVTLSVSPATQMDPWEQSTEAETEREREEAERDLAPAAGGGAGGYLCSGGEEGVLVLWQIAGVSGSSIGGSNSSYTRIFLPRLGAPISHAAIIPLAGLDEASSGLRVIVCTVDNAVRIISTASMQTDWTLRSLSVGIQQGSGDSEAFGAIELGNAHEFEMLSPFHALEKSQSVQSAYNWQPLLRKEPRTGYILCNGYPGKLQAMDVATTDRVTSKAPFISLKGTPKSELSSFAAAHNIVDFVRVSKTEADQCMYVPSLTHFECATVVASTAAGGKHFDHHLVTVDVRKGQDLEAEHSLKFWKWSDQAGRYRLLTQVDNPHTNPMLSHSKEREVGISALALSGSLYKSSDSAVDSGEEDCVQSQYLLCATGGVDGTVKVWRGAYMPSTDASIPVLSAHANASAGYAGPKQALTVSRPSMQWTWTCAYSFTHRNSAVCTLAFSADGSLLAVGSAHELLTLWDPLTLELRASLVVPTKLGTTNSAARKPKGKGKDIGTQANFVRFLEPGAGISAEAYLVMGTASSLTLFDLLTMEVKWTVYGEFSSFSAAQSDSEALHTPPLPTSLPISVTSRASSGSRSSAWIAASVTVRSVPNPSELSQNPDVLSQANTDIDTDTDTDGHDVDLNSHAKRGKTPSRSSTVAHNVANSMAAPSSESFVDLMLGNIYPSRIFYPKSGKHGAENGRRVQHFILLFGLDTVSPVAVVDVPAAVKNMAFWAPQAANTAKFTRVSDSKLVLATESSQLFSISSQKSTSELDTALTQAHLHEDAKSGIFLAKITDATLPKIPVVPVPAASASTVYNPDALVPNPANFDAERAAKSAEILDAFLGTTSNRLSDLSGDLLTSFLLPKTAPQALFGASRHDFVHRQAVKARAAEFQAMSVIGSKRVADRPETSIEKDVDLDRLGALMDNALLPCFSAPPTRPLTTSSSSSSFSASSSASSSAWTSSAPSSVAAAVSAAVGGAAEAMGAAVGAVFAAASATAVAVGVSSPPPPTPAATATPEGTLSPSSTTTKTAVYTSVNTAEDVSATPTRRQSKREKTVSAAASEAALGETPAKTPKKSSKSAAQAQQSTPMAPAFGGGAAATTAAVERTDFPRKRAKIEAGKVLKSASTFTAELLLAKQAREAAGDQTASEGEREDEEDDEEEALRGGPIGLDTGTASEGEDSSSDENSSTGSISSTGRGRKQKGKGAMAKTAKPLAKKTAKSAKSAAESTNVGTPKTGAKRKVASSTASPVDSGESGSESERDKDEVPEVKKTRGRRSAAGTAAAKRARVALETASSASESESEAGNVSREMHGDTETEVEKEAVEEIALEVATKRRVGRPRKNSLPSVAPSTPDTDAAEPRAKAERQKVVDLVKKEAETANKTGKVTKAAGKAAKRAGKAQDDAEGDMASVSTVAESESGMRRSARRSTRARSASITSELSVDKDTDHEELHRDHKDTENHQAQAQSLQQQQQQEADAISNNQKEKEIEGGVEEEAGAASNKSTVSRRRAATAPAAASIPAAVNARKTAAASKKIASKKGAAKETEKDGDKDRESDMEGSVATASTTSTTRRTRSSSKSMH